MRTALRTLFAIASLAFTLLCRGDSLHELVRYDCDALGGEVMVSYHVAYNEAGEKLMQSAGEDTWDPWTLVEVDKFGERITRVKTIRRRCKLNEEIYLVEISGAPGNWNLRGEGGGDMSARVVILKEKKRLLDIVLGGTRPEEPVVAWVSIRAGSSKPSIRTIPYDDFYRAD